MPTADAPPPAGDACPAPAVRGERGLITLEWLLIVAAIAGLAASSTLIVQRVIDDTSEAPDDPLVRLLEADVAAAFIADDADAAALAGTPPPQVDAVYGARCNTLEADYDGVVDTASWTPPVTTPASPGPPPTPARLSLSSECTVTPEPNLGGA